MLDLDSTTLHDVSIVNRKSKDPLAQNVDEAPELLVYLDSKKHSVMKQHETINQLKYLLRSCNPGDIALTPVLVYIDIV